MNRVAIHLSGPPPIDRAVLQAVFHQVQDAGGRVVTVAQDAEGEEEALGDLIYRLGDDFDQPVQHRGRRTLRMARAG